MTLTPEELGNRAENHCFRWLLNVEDKMKIKALKVLDIKLKYRLAIIKDWDIAEARIKKILGDDFCVNSEQEAKNGM